VKKARGEGEDGVGLGARVYLMKLVKDFTDLCKMNCEDGQVYSVGIL